MKRHALSLSTLTLLVAVTILSACGKEEKAPSMGDLMKNLPTGGTLPSGNGTTSPDPKFEIPSGPDFKTPSLPSFPTPSAPGFKLPAGGFGLPTGGLGGGLGSRLGGLNGSISRQSGSAPQEDNSASDGRSPLQGNVGLPGFGADPKDMGPGGSWVLEEKKTSHTETNQITFARNYVVLRTKCHFGYYRLEAEVASPVQYAQGKFAVEKTAEKIGESDSHSGKCRARLDRGVYAYQVDGERMTILANGEQHPVVLDKQ